MKQSTDSFNAVFFYGVLYETIIEGSVNFYWWLILLCYGVPKINRPTNKQNRETRERWLALGYSETVTNQLIGKPVNQVGKVIYWKRFCIRNKSMAEGSLEQTVSSWQDFIDCVCTPLLNWLVLMEQQRTETHERTLSTPRSLTKMFATLMNTSLNT